jgi:hypothetical protein
MMQRGTASEHDPVIIFQGEPGRAACEQLRTCYSVDDTDGWLELIERTLAEGGAVVIERSGDWLIFPA